MDNDINSITHAGVVFLIFLFVMITFYFLLSTPVEALFDAFGEADVGEANDEMAQFLPYIKTAVNIAFAIGVATPVTWFIFWVFSREPAYSRIDIDREVRNANTRDWCMAVQLSFFSITNYSIWDFGILFVWIIFW